MAWLMVIISQDTQGFLLMYYISQIKHGSNMCARLIAVEIKLMPGGPIQIFRYAHGLTTVFDYLVNTF